MELLVVSAGFNVCIFAYGQTGSGKTHTMSGTDTHHESGRGINYRALDDLFGIRDNRGEVSCRHKPQHILVQHLGTATSQAISLLRAAGVDAVLLAGVTRACGLLLCCCAAV